MTSDLGGYVVVVGASAGGLEAIEAFFDAMPSDTGASFVVVQHLSPDFRSATDELLARHTEMAIHRVEDGMDLERNAIHLVPPGRDMVIESGRLRLSAQPPRRSPNLPIDSLLRSVAADRGDRAIGIILSGTGTDGSRGVTAINESGGLVGVQEPAQDAPMTSGLVFRDLTERLDDVFWISEADPRRLLYVSPRFEVLWGRPVARLYEEGGENVWLDAVVPEDRPTLEKAWRDAETFDVEYRIRDPHGGLRWIRSRSFPIRDARGDVVRFAGFARDVTEQRLREHELLKTVRRLDERANTDSLTGLYSRHGLEVALQKELERARRSGSRLAMILLQVEGFQDIVQTFGHGVGELLLRDVGRRHVAALRPTDCTGRIDGDRFLTLLPETRLAEAMQVARRLKRNLMRAPISVGEVELDIGTLVAIARVPSETVTLEEAIERVHGALRSGRADDSANGIGILDASGADESEQLRSILEDDCLRVARHALVELRSRRTLGYEFLIRGPGTAFASPYDLFRFAIGHQVLTVLDLKCLRACSRVAARFEGSAHLNVMPSTLLETPPDRIVELLASSGAPVDRFCLEISEQQFVGDTRYLIDAVHALKARGVRIAIDDVGFGRSCLESLIVLEPDVVKVDRAFVGGVAQDEGKQRHLSRLQKVIECCGAIPIAEGVEVEEDIEYLLSLGFDIAQGFFFGKPELIEDDSIVEGAEVSSTPSTPTRPTGSSAS